MTISSAQSHSMSTSRQQNTPPIPVSVSVNLADEEIQSSISAQLQYTSKASNHTQPPSYLKLFTNELFISRIIIFLLTIFMFLLSVSYTFGQILSVELTDFWCKRVTLSDIRDHSAEINSNTGETRGSCWSTKQHVVNYKIQIELCKLSVLLSLYGRFFWSFEIVLLESGTSYIKILRLNM